MTLALDFQVQILDYLTSGMIGLIDMKQKGCKSNIHYHDRARHLFFPQLGSRTTLKQYGLLRIRDLVGHNDNILIFAFVKKKIGENFEHLCVSFFYFRIIVFEAHIIINVLV